VSAAGWRVHIVITSRCRCKVTRDPYKIHFKKFENSEAVDATTVETFSSGDKIDEDRQLFASGDKIDKTANCLAGHRRAGLEKNKCRRSTGG